MIIDLIPDSEARKLLRQYDRLDTVVKAHLEYWRWVRYPIKTALVLTDFENVYLPEYCVTIGEFYDYNLPDGICKVFSCNNILYHGKFDPEERRESDMIEMHILADQLCHKFIKKCWGKC